MQYLSKDFQRKLSEFIKAGQYSRPRCVVEVDRMALFLERLSNLL